MPGLDGIEATRQLAGPGVAAPLAVVVITNFDLDEYVYAALRAGARVSCSRTQARACSPRRSTPPHAATR
jgi:DNA-binding NarL/FixJ family response regulator